MATALPVARAFSHFLNLANIAEQHHRIRRRRDYQRDSSAGPQRGSCDDAFARLLASGIDPAELYDAVTRLDIELVLTAHPTEIARRTIVQKHNRIAAALAVNDRTDLTEPEREAVIASLRREIAGAWATREIREQRPTPLDEVRSGLIVFEQSLWTAVPLYVRAVDRALHRHTGRSLPLDAAPIRFGSWIGGDRDGNPHVTPEVTRRASLLARWVAVRLYLSDLDRLRSELSMYRGSDELAAMTGDAPEPYRSLLRQLRGRLEATRSWIDAALQADEPVEPPDDALVESTDLLRGLLLCHRSLVDTGESLIADGQLTDIVRRVVTFGMVLAPLDVRQESARHSAALGVLTTASGLGAYDAWNEEARMAFLVRALSHGVPPLPATLDATPEVTDVLATFRMIARLPASAFGAYVITMASQASDVLAVEYLQRAARVPSPLRVVPLFETSADLGRAGGVLESLLRVDWYRDRIGGRQEVMIGYSDSAKDVGRFAAGWDLFKAQEAIVAACRAHGVRVTLFHGRGGSVGRGGGPTHLALLSQPPGSIDGTLRVTEQGEMIQALFGLTDIAQRTLEVYTTGTLESWLTPSPAARPEWRRRMDGLAAAARAEYRSTVYDDPRFLEYFQAATPADELSTMNIGSRPARRRSGTSIGSLRAIPWQFAWTQTRLMLAAWLGIERALRQAIGEGSLEDVRTMYREWPHFRSSIQLIEMVLAKADARIAAEYDRRLVPDDLRPLGEDLRRRLSDAVASVLAVTGEHELLEGSPVLRRSIEVRNPYVDPINLVQVELLRRLRQHDDDEVRRALMLTINGVAAGMRNTG
jgi:phosphoenolpyruvate carboxylase